MSKLKPLNEYAELAADLVDNPDNSHMREMWSAIDRMVECEITIPPEIRNLPWVGQKAKFVSTLPQSAVDAVTRFLSTRNPSIKLMPMLPAPNEHERMEFGETVLKWHWNRMNERGAEPVRTQIVNSVARHAAVAVRTKFMPWEVKRNDSEGKPLYTTEQQKLMRRKGDFNWIVYPRSSVYDTWTEDVLHSIVSAKIISVQQLINEYGKDHKAIRKMIEKNWKDKKPEVSELRANYVSVYNFMDSYCSGLWFAYNGVEQELNTDTEEIYELMREEHKIGFLPWVVVDYRKPILKGVYDAKLYEQNAIERTIFYSKMLQLVADKDTVVSAPNPNDPNLVDDELSPAGERVVGPGVSINRLMPHQLDPNLMTALNNSEREMAAAAAVSALVAIEQYIGGNTPFSSINAAQSTAAAHLGPVQNAVERVIEQGLFQELQWMQTSGEGVMGYREQERGKGDTDTTRAGARFMLRAHQTGLPQPNFDVVEFDPYELMVKVELNPMTIQDRQAEANLAVIKQQAGLSFATSTEHLIDDPADEINKRGEELLVMSMLNADKMRIEAEGQAQAILATAQQQAQMILEQAKMQQQQGQGQPGVPPTQQTQMNQMNAGAQTQTMKGRDVRAGSSSMAEVAPGETPVSTTGQAGGRELA